MKEKLIATEVEGSNKYTREDLEKKGLFKRGQKYEVPGLVYEWMSAEYESNNEKRKRIMGTDKPFIKNISQTIRDFNAYLMQYFYTPEEEKTEKIRESEPIMQKKVEKAFQEIEKMDQRDELTQLYNRDKLLGFVAESIKKYEGDDQNMSLVICNTDIDYFKCFNDAFGHLFGNLKLQEVAGSINDFIEPFEKDGKGVAARVGGEEKTMAFLVDKGEDVYSMIERFKDEIRDSGEFLLNRTATTYKSVGVDIDIKKSMFDVLIEKRTNEFNREILENHRQDFEEIKKDLSEIGFDFDGNVEPAILYTIIDNKLSGNNNNDELRAVRDKFFGLVTFGTATFGFVNIDLSQKKSDIVPEDLQFIHESVNQKDPYISQDTFDKVFESFGAKDGWLSKPISYSEFRDKINQQLETLRKDKTANQKEIDQWQRLLDGLYLRRAGRCIDQANAIQESQKLVKRASVGCVDEGDRNKKINLTELDSESLVGGKEQEVRFDKETMGFLREEIHSLQNDLARLQKADNDKDFDPRLDILERYSKKIVDKLTKKDRLPEWQGVLLEGTRKRLKDGQLFRFFDHLARAFNERYMLIKMQKDLDKAIKENKSYTLAAVDLNYLKAINETAGHFVGDIVLMKFALITRNFLNKLNKEKGIESEFVRVTGGEEFVISFLDIGSRRARVLLSELAKQVKQEVHGFLEKVKTKSGQNLLELAKEYAETNTNGSQKTSPDEVGTFTAGVIDVRDLDLDSFVIHGKNFKIGQLRQLADSLGEKIKEQGDRGVVGNLSYLEKN